MVGAGAAAVVVAERSNSGGSAAPAPAGATTRAPAEGDAAGAEGVSPRGYPSVTRTQMTEEIHTLLLTFHEDVVNRDFRAAWALLSPRKRRQDLSEPDGYHGWMAAQASLSPYLSPGGLKVRLDSLEGEGVARVMLSGMGWSQPRSPCREWSGLTWVKYQEGEWTYDPGYSTTPSRRRTWQGRSGELLGIGC